MGVPSFYRWLVNKYPKTVRNAVEDAGEFPDCTAPNPNGIEFDNLYLDMNGIIHPCFHPEDKNVFSPTSFDDVFRGVYEYIDRLFKIVRPRKLLFLAIDGVAPRAKMNQQRARRFRTAKDTQIAEEMEEKLRNQFEREGKTVFPKEESELADSNVITPGTEFMHVLSLKLQDYIGLRMKENPAWSKIKVILSDATVPGEGEHKIMSFIRAQRSSPGYDPNTRHCLYGLDADLIMLALATHEIHFSILREEVSNSTNQVSLATTESNIDRAGTRFQKSSSDPVIETKDLDLNKEARWSVKKKQPYQFLHIWVLRQYLELDLEVDSVEKSECDLERIIDDFIFICFFAGNDFLPHIPSLEIHEGCLDLLIHVYKKEFQNLGGYLVDIQKVEDKKGGYMKLKRVEKFILKVGSYEEEIFKKRCELRDKKLRWILNEHQDAKECERRDIEDERASDIAISCHDVYAHEVSSSHLDYDTVLNNTEELKLKLKEYIRNQSDLFKDGCLGTDHVKFGASGFKERYYQVKFHAQNSHEIEAIRKEVVAKYGEGLRWVLLYYFSGVPSWTWFYPYHYGPLASDFKGLSQTSVRFKNGLPFKPFDQLMGVLPPRSAHALPSPYRALMIDKDSKITDFYPMEFETDTDGKRFLWQGVSKLPFIDEERLLTETKKVENDLNDHEKMRNFESLDRLFVRWSNKEIQCLLGDGIGSKKIKDAITMNCPIEGVKGTIYLLRDDLIGADDNNQEDARIDLCVFYEVNQGLVVVPRLLENVNIPEKTVSREDMIDTILWHEANNGDRYRRRGLMKPEYKLESGFQNPNPVGFSAGRGKSSTAGGERHMSQTSSSSGRARGDYGSFQGLRISDSNPHYVVPNNRAWPTQTNSNRWSSESKEWRVRAPRDEVVGPSWQMNRGSGPSINTGYGRGRSQDSNTGRGRGRWQEVNTGFGRGRARGEETGPGRGRGWFATGN